MHADVAESIIIGEVVNGMPISLNVCLKYVTPNPFSFNFVFFFYVVIIHFMLWAQTYSFPQPPHNL